MKNQKLYLEYAILELPNHFYMSKTVDRYNTKIKKYCNQLPEGSTGFTRYQLFKRYFYIRYLDIYDVIIFKAENRKPRH